MAPGMKWDDAADAKLFGLFLNVFDIKITGDMMKKLNQAMGLDPKSQAIAHRIGTARKRAAGSLSGDAMTPVKAAPLTPRGPKSGGGGGGSGTPRNRSTGKSKGRKSAVKHESDDDDSDDSDTHASPIANTGVKRGRSARATAGARLSYKEPETDEDEALLEEGDELEDEERGAAVKKAKVERSGEDEGRENGVEEGVQKSFFEGDGGMSEAEEV